jgi:hypothetical protein
MREFTAWEEAKKSNPATPPPGWYPDSVVPDTERYWIGTEWSDVTRPLVQHKPDSSFAWALIAVPLVPVAVALLAPQAHRYLRNLEKSFGRSSAAAAFS